jgi:peptidoglycan/xylan/chitin deacetylase (PgdA/CDA1 family)
MRHVLAAVVSFAVGVFGARMTPTPTVANRPVTARRDAAGTMESQSLRLNGVSVPATSADSLKQHDRMLTVARNIERAKKFTTPTMRRYTSAAAYYGGLYQLLGRSYGGVGVIFMLHRVVPDTAHVLDPGFTVTVGAVDRALTFVRRCGWDIVDLTEATRRLETGDERRFAAFTFDDGYADNLTHALPVFRKHNAPFAVYLSTGFLDRSLVYWWGGLEEMVRRNDRVVIPASADRPERSVSARTPAEKRYAYQALSASLHSQPDELTSIAAALLQGHGIDAREMMDRDALSIEQARELASDPLVTVGSHCVTHTRLRTLPDAEVEFELDESRRRLEAWLRVAVEHLAYPFGGPDATGAREYELAVRAGYRTAVTTRRGNIFPEHRRFCHALPRRIVTEDIVGMRNALFGVETLLRQDPFFQTI